MADEEIIFIRRKLPHIQPKDSIFFITFRLLGSLPLNVVSALKEEYDSRLKLLKEESEECREQFDPSVLHRWYFEQFDEFLENIWRDRNIFLIRRLLKSLLMLLILGMKHVTALSVIALCLTMFTL